jgi:NADH:ubiquinone oxidoreductase subunit 5 (subunit L)/multisubunit Na+/H+ antiporter MnhA subunit/multisubunit Na+/H+ antiporter MnhB subunit
VVLLAAGCSVALLGQLALQPVPSFFRAAWLPAIGVTLALSGDSFGLFLALLVAAIGVLVVLYSLGYLSEEDAERARRYYAALAAFMGAMLGVALADDLILFFVFWEVTSLSSFVLIGHRFDDEDAKAGAVTALLVTALGGIVMSVGFLLVGQVAGTFSLSTIATDRERVAQLLASPLADWALLCILCGAFTKSAQVPFHFWLPRAMVAPTPVSAYLHAATMVKAGVFLIGRVLPIFGESPLWAPVLVTVGTVSMVFGAYQASRETDLKAILARTTASTLGLIVLLYGLRAAEQDALQILSHALYKGALFLVAGIVEHRTHTRDLGALGGLRRELPLAFAACVLAALSMAGLPPLAGFLAKESFYTAVIHSPALAGHPWFGGLVMAASILSSGFLACVAYRLTAGVFLGASPGALARHLRKHPSHDSTPLLWAPPLLLAVGALALGLLAATPLSSALMAQLSSQPAAALHLSLIPSLEGPLLASIAALALAFVLHRERHSIAAAAKRLGGLPSADAVWDRALAMIVGAGEAFSSRWENGSLGWYLGVTSLAVPLLCIYTLEAVGLSYREIRVSLSDLPWYGLVYCVLLAVATMAVVRARTRLAAAIATTTIGFLVAMLYVVYRSPDILLTQILIETVSTIFLLLVLVHLPPFRLPDLSPASRLVNATIAGAFGLSITVLLLLAMTPGFREADNIATRPGGLLALSLAEGGGANAVNVIIVDIRAMDTNGEITVLVVVGLCIYGLLRARRGTT